MDDCVFCKIIDKKIPCTIVYENDNVLAILSKDMEVYSHTLLIPKKHYQDIYAIPEEILCEIMKATKKLTNIYKEKLGATGINILHASGKDAQQSIFHFHIHLFPRFENDGVDARPKLQKIGIDNNEILKKLQ